MKSFTTMPRLTSSPAACAQLRVRPDARRDHDQFRFELFAGREAQAIHMAVAEQRGGLSRQHHANRPGSSMRRFRYSPPVASSCRSISVSREVNDRHVAAAHLQAARRFQPQQPAADHHGLQALARLGQQRLGIVQRAENVNVLLVDAWNRRNERAAPGGEDQLVVRRRAALVRPMTVRASRSIFAIFTPSRAPNVVRPVPLHIVENDFVGRLLAGQHQRQQDAVVIDMRLIAEDGDFEIRLLFQDLLDAGHPGHAIADHYESFHECVLPERSTRTAHCL